MPLWGKKHKHCCNIRGQLRQSIIGYEYFCLRTMNSVNPDGSACDKYNRITDSVTENLAKLKKRGSFSKR
jgi:hypothetical protein